jgi:hypothetical protein
MQKSTWLMTMVGLFLSAALIWAVPAFAQAQGGQGGVCPRGYNQGAGPGWGGGPGNCPNYNAQTCPGYGYGYGKQTRGRNRARGNTQQAPANPNPQTQPQTPAPQSGN